MKTALVLVDIQNDYFPGGANPLWKPEEAANRARGALEYFRENGWPVVHVRHENTRPGAAFFLPGTAGSAIHELVRPVAGEAVVEKHAPDSFLQTPLQAHLEALGAKRLVVCGMMSHMCIDTTVRSAKAREYETFLLHDACTTKDLSWDGAILPAESVHRAFMASLQGMFARVIGTENLGSV